MKSKAITKKIIAGKFKNRILKLPLKKTTKSESKLRDSIISSINIAEIILERVGSDALDMLKYITKKICIAK